ncbi:MAG TPA: ATP-binding protein [Verrucomicrobiae bacterium]|nr:ATP-binding protein [Verrucomicrobiae bacterium]
MNLSVALPFVATMLLALVPPLYAQSTNRWRVFSRTDGLPDNACLSVTPGASGNILVRHLRSTEISILDGYDITTVPGPGLYRRRVYESPGGQLWTVAPDGLQEFRDGQWVSYRIDPIANHFGSGQTNDVVLLAVRQGRVLILLPDQLLQFEAEDPDHPNLRLLRRADPASIGSFVDLQVARDGDLWIIGTKGLEKTAGPLRNLRSDQSWIATDDVPPEIQGTQVELPSADELSVRKIYDTLVQPDGVIWVATSDGLFRRAPQIWEPESTLPSRTNQPMPRPALPDHVERRANWNVFHTTRSGDLWLGSANEIAWRHENSWRFFSSTNQIGPEEVLGFAEALDGRIWCATPTQVWHFDGRNWNILRGSFTRINSLYAAHDGTLWVASEDGAYRYTQGNWIVNGPEDGLPSPAVREIFEDATGRITAITSRGAAKFRVEADPDPPETSLVTADVGENSFREGSMLTLSFRGRDKWKHTTTGRLLFSYRWDDREWTQFQDSREAPLADLALGKHYFQVRAMDRNGNIDLSPAQFEFTIVVPWYRETRLVLVLSVALGIALFFAGLAMNRHRRLKLSYAEVERKVTERTRELEMANQELLHSQKMNALGTLSAGIAHDFNNILSIIKGSTQIIEDNLDKPEKIRTRLDRIKTVVQQGAGIVEAMLGFSRNSDQQTELSDVNTIVSDTLKLLGDRFLREVEVKFQRAQGLPRIAVARDFVQQVLLNFIFNAAEAMTDRKQITLTTRFVEAPPPGIILSPAQNGSCIAISVKDSGSGIAPENLSRIFEPFFTTKAMSARRGTGLGLSMVYELAKKLEAGLAVETAVGSGSTFTLFLPIKSEPARLVQSEIQMRS